MSDDLCDMKIKNIRDLAKEKNINLKDSKGKLKSKCQLIIDIIKKIYSSLLPDEIDLSNMKLDSEVTDEIDFSEFELENPKNVKFGNVTETIVETQNKPGKKLKNKSYTRKLLNEEEIKNFIPSKKSSKGIARQKERNMMSMEDINVNPKKKPKIRKNDADRYSVISINNVRYARKANDSGPRFELFEIEDFRTPSDFSTTGSSVPIAMYDAIDREIRIYKKK